MLSKTNYLRGLQCPKLLWIAVHEKEKIVIDSATQALFDTGHLVGGWAKKMFPNGVDVPEGDFKGNLSETDKLLKEKKVIFEAGILVDGLYSRADVLVPNEDGLPCEQLMYQPITSLK